MVPAWGGQGRACEGWVEVFFSLSNLTCCGRLHPPSARAPRECVALRNRFRFFSVAQFSLDHFTENL
jgi:hypothetical protein